MKNNNIENSRSFNNFSLTYYRPFIKNNNKSLFWLLKNIFFSCGSDVNNKKYAWNEDLWNRRLHILISIVNKNFLFYVAHRNKRLTCSNNSGATTDDLWNKFQLLLEEESEEEDMKAWNSDFNIKEDFRTLMKLWENQSGVPVLTVTKNKHSVAISQVLR